MRETVALHPAYLVLYLIGWSLAALTACGALYCLFTGLNPSRRRPWYDRVWRVVTAIVGSFLVYLFLFGDS